MVHFKKLFLLLISFFVIMNSSFALSINIFGEVNEYSKIYSESIEVTINCSENLNLTIPNGATNVYFQNNPISHKNVEITNCKSKNIISYHLDKLEFLTNGIQRVERNFLGYENINYTYSLIIPIEFKVDANNTVPSRFNVLLNNNKKLINFAKNNIYVIYIKKVKEVSVLSTSHFQKEIKEPAAIILMFFSFLLGIFLTFFYFSRYKKSEQMQKVPSFVLSKDEREILDIIKKNPGINQKHIGDELDFSKSRVSMFISDLEQKKLIRRERFGRSFKVYMEKEII